MVPERATTGEQVFPTRSLTVPQARIDLYAALSGDYNPLHVDPAFGARSPFRSTIAHGPLCAALFFDVVGDWLGETWPEGVEFDVVFTAPVQAGDSVVVSVSAAGDDEGAVVELQCTKQSREVAIRATARSPRPPTWGVGTSATSSTTNEKGLA